MRPKINNSFKDYQATEFRHRPAIQIGIIMDDIESSLDFYVNNLGCRLIRDSDRLIVLDFFGVELNLIIPENKDKYSYSREPLNFFGLSVHWDDWHRAIDHLNYIGITYYEKPRVEEDLGNKVFASFSFKDPSGNILKFSAFKS